MKLHFCIFASTKKYPQLWPDASAVIGNQSRNTVETPCFVLPCQIFWTLRCLSQKLFLPDPGWQCFFASMTGMVEPQKISEQFLIFFFSMVCKFWWICCHLVIWRFGKCVQILPVWNSRHPKRTPKIFPGKKFEKMISVFPWFPKNPGCYFPLKSEGWNSRGETTICWLKLGPWRCSHVLLVVTAQEEPLNHRLEFFVIMLAEISPNSWGLEFILYTTTIPMIYRVCCRVLVIFPIYFMHLSAVWIGPPSALWHMYRYDITSGDRPRRVWLATIVDLDKRANARRQSCRAESLRDFWNRCPSF